MQCGAPCKLVCAWLPHTDSGAFLTHAWLMQAMSRPTYNTVLQYAKAKPAIIFAPTRRHAQAIATDILTYTAGDAAPTRFLKVPLDTLEPFLERVTDTAAHTCASAGVGILHDTMSQEDIKTINHLFNSNALQVCPVRRSGRGYAHACYAALPLSVQIQSRTDQGRIVVDYGGICCGHIPEIYNRSKTRGQRTWR